MVSCCWTCLFLSCTTSGTEGRLPSVHADRTCGTGSLPSRLEHGLCAPPWSNDLVLENVEVSRQSHDGQSGLHDPLQRMPQPRSAALQRRTPRCTMLSGEEHMMECSRLVAAKGLLLVVPRSDAREIACQPFSCIIPAGFSLHTLA